MEAGNHAIRWYQTLPIGDENVMGTGGCHPGRNQLMLVSRVYGAPP